MLRLSVLEQWLAQAPDGLEVHLSSIEREKVIEQVHVGVYLLHKSPSLVLIHFVVHLLVVIFEHFCLEGREHLWLHSVLEEEEVGEDQEDLAVELRLFLEEGFEVSADVFPRFLAHVAGENFGSVGDSSGAVVLREVVVVFPLGVLMVTWNVRIDDLKLKRLAEVVSIEVTIHAFFHSFLHLFLVILYHQADLKQTVLMAHINYYFLR